MRKPGLVIVTALIIFGPLYYFYRHPSEQMPPLAQFLLDILLFVCAYMISQRSAVEDAERRANQKWVPQSRQACRGLLTVWSEVQTLRLDVSEMCSIITKDIPEMQAPKMQGARTVLSAQCGSNAQRLDGIGDHLLDALAAWETFIGANCEGLECAIISEELATRKAAIEAKIAARSREKCNGESANLPSGSEDI
ncbi:MAG TPA: hypothetical protein VHD36_02005 [Pirellulales bacterium]|nr:hypothetical protein [Pirellulales bacterium]